MMRISKLSLATTLSSKYIPIDYKAPRKPSLNTAHIMLTSRTIFRDMIALANTSIQRDPFHLTHPAIEHSLVIKEALDVVYKCDFDYKLVQKDSNLVKLVIDFARKWEMSVIIDIIHKELYRSQDLCGGQLVGHFLAALHLEALDLALDFYMISGSLEWAREMNSQEKKEKGAMNKQDQGGPKDELHALHTHYHTDIAATGLPADHPLVASPGGEIYNLGVMPYREFLHIPSTVGLILLRAQTMSRDKGVDEYESIRALLNLACK